MRLKYLCDGVQDYESAGWACLVLLAFYWLVDIRGYRKWVFPLTVIGMNAIFIYMFTSLVHVGPIVDVFTRDIVAHPALDVQTIYLRQGLKHG